GGTPGGVGGGCGGMKNLALASVGLLALAATLRTAAAADADVYGPPPVVYGPRVTVVLFTWTGFYFGGHVGGAWGSKNETGNPYPFFNGLLTDTITPPPASVNDTRWLRCGPTRGTHQHWFFTFRARGGPRGQKHTPLRA